jgi:hypothetical protein
MTCMYIACSNPEVEMVEYLYERGGKNLLMLRDAIMNSIE